VIGRDIYMAVNKVEKKSKKGAGKREYCVPWVQVNVHSNILPRLRRDGKGKTSTRKRMEA